VAPGGDRRITVAWDNLSESTADPKSNQFDFYSYKIWRAANWTRPVGSSGPGENDWSLIGEYVRWPANQIETESVQQDTVSLYVPNYWQKPIPEGSLPLGWRRDSVVTLQLDRGDLLDFQSGHIIHPEPVDCVRDTAGDCLTTLGLKHGANPTTPGGGAVRITHYPIGRYTYRDTLVQNGFIYFYSITAKDSNDIGPCDPRKCLEGRRSAVESEGVVPQASLGNKVWVVPNPYRGRAQWDLTPNASDPTGTHIDFFGMPPAPWTLRIYTVAGDLVQTIRSSDPVNESLRTPVADPRTGQMRPGFNLQADTPNDGQARWNLITRSGQDVVSGIYLFTVESAKGTQVGKFVVVR
jgi:hypothetical protein